MGGKNLAKAIRRINKGSKANEPTLDPKLFPAGSIIAVDLSTLLVPYVKSKEGAAQTSAVPAQSCTCIEDKLEAMYLKKIKPRKWRMVSVIDASLDFKDEVVRASRNKIKEAAMRELIAIRGVGDRDASLLKKLRKAEKGISSVTNDVIANAVKWSRKRPGLTCVSTTHKLTARSHPAPHEHNIHCTHTHAHTHTKHTNTLLHS